MRCSSARNSIAFWLLGLCNNFAYVVMLSAAKDILENDGQESTPKPCKDSITSRDCHLISTGVVLLADIIPSFLIKLVAPFFIHRLPFGIRHIIVVFLQAASFVIVGLSDSTGLALFGVVLASLGSGLGETSYLALSANYPPKAVAAWASGTGGAGMTGSLTYALLTDPKFLSISPKNSMLLMLTLPAVFAIAYWIVLEKPETVRTAHLTEPSTWILPKPSEAASKAWTMSGIRPLLPFMIPLMLVYFGEYYINQGLVELLEFDCPHGFSMNPESQYRWFQVTYQLGVFVSRSSSNFFTIPAVLLPFLALLQLSNAIFFTFAAIFAFIPHVVVAFSVIFFEGLIGGGSYVNTFRAVHRKVPAEEREFAMSVVSISDGFGIVTAGFLAMPVHNKICSMSL